jgi:putative PIN family toxin of toxin-antitoxin system
MSESSRSLRVTVDTNVFVSAFLRAGSVPDLVLTAWEHDEYQLVIDTELHAEIADALARPKLLQRYTVALERRERLLRELRAAVQTFPRIVLPIHCRDPKDDMLLACALGGGADMLVTGDRDLLVLDGDPALGGLRVLSPQDFLEMLAERKA